MSVFNYFSKIITGYQSKIRTIGGIQVHYKFSGKAILFDPVEMLRDLKFKISGSEIPALKLFSSIENFQERLLNSTKQQNETVIASFELGKRKIKVMRSVKTIDNMPCSRYDFFLDENLISVFQRQYDYGKGFAISLQKMESYGSEPPTQNNTSCYWTNNDTKQSVFFEKFGHTYLWLIYDSIGLEEVWKNLS